MITVIAAGASGGLSRHDLHGDRRVRVPGARGPGQLLIGDDPGLGGGGHMGAVAVPAGLGRLRVCRASGPFTEITLSSATFRAIRHRPSVPSLPSADSTSRPATRASSATADSGATQPCGPGSGTAQCKNRNRRG